MPEPSPITRDSVVSFREITGETVRTIIKLSDTLSEEHRKMVAPNAVSIAQAHFEKRAWFRAIYAGETPVGFIMLYDNVDECEYFLWRLMIAEPYQKWGFGKKAIGLLLDYVKTRPGATKLGVSCGQGEGSPEGFYIHLGFKLTGEMDGEEEILELPLE